MDGMSEYHEGNSSRKWFRYKKKITLLFLGIEWIGFYTKATSHQKNPNILRNKYQERYTTHTSVEGVGQFHNSAQERGAHT